MSEMISVRLLKRGAYRAVDLEECERLPIHSNHEATLGLGVLTQWIVKHYGVGRCVADPPPRSPDRVRSLPVEMQSPQPHAIFRDPADGIVFVETWGARWLPIASRTTRYYQVAPAILQKYLEVAKFDDITRTRWSGKTRKGRTGQRRDGHKTAECLAVIQEAFRDHMEKDEQQYPTLEQLAMYCGYSDTPAREAYRDFYKSSEYKDWRRVHPNDKWGANIKGKP